MPNGEISQIQLPNGDVYDIRDSNVSNFKTNIDEETLSDGQFMVYDAEHDEWVNNDSIPSSSVTYDNTNSGLEATDVQSAIDEIAEDGLKISKTASGSIATFPDGGDNIPLKSFECEIVAQQESGTPTPTNPLPISGFLQADIAVGGKNLFNSVGALTNTYVNDLGALQNSNGWMASDFINVTPNTSYYFQPNSTVGNTAKHAFYSSPNESDFIDYINSGAQSFTTPNNCHYMRFSYRDASSDIMLNLGSVAETYEPYIGNAYIVEFGQTIYGGRLIYSNGQWVIEATYEIIDMGDLTWSYSSSQGWFQSSKPTGAKAATDMDLLCSCYSYSTSSSTDLTIFQTTNNLRVNDSNYTDADVFKTSVTGQKLVYELATPVIISLTSTVKVKTVSGLNNIYANTGDVSLEYFIDKADDIEELIKDSETPAQGVIYDNASSGLTSTDVQSAIDEIDSKFYKEAFGTLIAGQTSVTIQSDFITADSTAEVFVDPAFASVMYTGCTITAGSVTLTFPAQLTDMPVKVRIS